jgi:hypothetical protein
MGYGRPKWKVSYIDAIHAQVEGGEFDNVGGIITPIIDDYLWAEHVN